MSRAVPEGVPFEATPKPEFIAVPAVLGAAAAGTSSWRYLDQTVLEERARSGG